MTNRQPCKTLLEGLLYLTGRVLIVTVIFASTNAAATLPDTQFFDFSGWDTPLIGNGGQDFNLPSIDGLVSFDTTITGNDFVLGMATHEWRGDWLELGFDDSLTFSFTQPINAVVKFEDFDSAESLTLDSTGSEQYFHMSGVLPTVTTTAAGIRIDGDAGGTAMGELYTGSTPVSQITVTYEGLNAITQGKGSARIMVGRVVPEPSSSGLAGVAALAWLLTTRKRRSNR